MGLIIPLPMLACLLKRTIIVSTTTCIACHHARNIRMTMQRSFNIHVMTWTDLPLHIKALDLVFKGLSRR